MATGLGQGLVEAWLGCVWSKLPQVKHWQALSWERALFGGQDPSLRCHSQFFVIRLGLGYSGRAFFWGRLNFSGAIAPFSC